MLPNRQVSIAVPASFVSDIPHLREKTVKIGSLARAAAIFRIDEIIIFPDFPNVNQSRDTNLIATILSYVETPQYLRKRLFKIKPELRYAGILPPLRTPHHPLSDKMKTLKVGEYREGAVSSLTENGSFVEIGVERPILIPNTRLSLDNRVTVRITELGKHPKAILANRREIQSYWGYRITVPNVSFGQLVKTRFFDLVIATSKHGAPFTKIRDKLTEHWKNSRSILIAFGAPTQGLYEIVAREHLELDNTAHFTVNMMPNQGTETVRTEEAVFASLAILNLLVF
jgi:predicted SPOUT superfamily RNA methylase MTH1